MSGKMKYLSLDLRSEDSPISSFPNEVLESIWWSRFAGPTGPLVGCILLSLDLAFQEDLVRGDQRSACSRHIEIISASGPRHGGNPLSRLRVVKTSVDGLEIFPAGHLVDGRIASAGIW